MNRSNSLERRLKEIEQGRGSGAVTFTFQDGSKQSFSFSRQDRLKILLANFQLERAKRNHAAPPANSRAIQIALLIRRALSATPPGRFWWTCGLGLDERKKITEGENHDAK
jgi:hypothetical protein